MARTRHVLVLAVEDCMSLDVFGPLEVFHHARLEVPGAYRISLGVSPAEYRDRFHLSI